MKKVFVIALILVSIISLNSFKQDLPIFSISKKDIALKIPKGFPKPNYSFKENKITPDGFLLGRKLFYDPILSKDYFLSCGTCHQQIAAFAHIDHKLSHGVFGKIGIRNVPAIQNLIWKDEFMLDGGINHMDLQPLAPITGETEMGEELSHVLFKLQKDSIYPSLFKKAFGDTSITTERLFKSLSQFVGLMISSNSKYDQVKNGKAYFTTEEQTGYKIFKLKCENCHKEPLFTDNSYQNIGLKVDPTIKDYGRYRITKNPLDSMKFKVPSLRNVEMTYPYMHDGRFNSLEQILMYYAEGKYSGSNIDPSLKKSIGLTKTEQEYLIAFLKTLTDKSFLTDRRFIDPNFKF